MAKITALEESATPPTPSTGQWKLYFKAGGLYILDDVGNETLLATGGVADGDKGDITVSTGGTVWTIDAGTISLAKMADMATASLIYRKSALAGAPEVNTLATLKTDLTLVKGDVGLGNVDNTSDVNKPVSTAQQTAIDNAVVGLMDFKGGTDCSTNPNYPSALKGDTYVVTFAGKIGGASGKSVDIGDMYFASADNAGGTEAAVGTSWSVIEHNLAGALLSANNLSDLASATTALTNLGLTANGKSLVTAADYAAMKVLLALTIGTNVQAWDADLDYLAGFTPSANVKSILNAADYAAIKTLMGLVIGTNVQAWDADLDTLSGKAIPSGVLVGTTDTQTLTNKRASPRTDTTTSSDTPTINTDNVEFYSLTAQAVDITSFTTNLSGTPTEAQKLWIAITGTAARAITWGASFEAGAVALPTTTVTTTRLDVGFVWNTVTSKWRCMASG